MTRWSVQRHPAVVPGSRGARVWRFYRRKSQALPKNDAEAETKSKFVVRASRAVLQNVQSSRALSPHVGDLRIILHLLGRVRRPAVGVCAMGAAARQGGARRPQAPARWPAQQRDLADVVAGAQGDVVRSAANLMEGEPRRLAIAVEKGV